MDSIGWRQVRIAGSLICLNFLMGSMFSLHAPFYPVLAKEMGVKPVVYGFVLGVYHIGIFVSSPIIGRYMHKLKPKTGIVAGSLIAATSCMLLGLLDEVEEVDTFICVSILLRICESLGLSLFLVVCAALTLSSFSDFAYTMMTWDDTAFGMGMILGPVLGGLLFGHGFKYPFMLVGGITFVFGVLAFVTLPPSIRTEEKKSSGSIKALIMIPQVWVGLTYTFLSAVCLGFMFVSLQPHAAAMGLSTMTISWMFVAEAAFFVCTSPLWGFLMDKKVNPRFIMLGGLVLTCLGVSFIGPLPVVGNMEPTAWSCFLGLALFGIGNSAEYIPGLVDPLTVVTRRGYPENMDTNSLVTGVWYSVYSLGSFLGPAIGGALYEYLGYKYLSVVMIALHIPVLLITVFCLYRSNSKQISLKDEDEEEQTELKHL